MKRLITFTLIFLGSFWDVKGQYHYVLSQYFQNMEIFNPAFTGFSNSLELKAGYRKQWAAFDGAPETLFLSFQTPLGRSGYPPFAYNSLRVSDPDLYFKLLQDQGNKKIKALHGIGGFVVSENLNLLKKVSFYASYSIRFQLRNNFQLGLGASGGYKTYQFDRDKFNVRNEENDALFESFLLNGTNSGSFDLNAGIALYSPKFHLSYSINQLVPDPTLLEESSQSPEINRFHYLTINYSLDLPSKLKVTPGFLLRYTASSPLLTYYSMELDYRDKIWAMVAYRTEKAIIAGLGMKLAKTLRLNYSYDFSLSAIGEYLQGSHEVMLRFEFPQFIRGSFY
ncbi:PorP/SprF family type IX secretion system membrane protein [Xanthovirga aplysinae]|uniref:PorP/SprF family type IX secretion system membrane protein n=1 Tax=Xanthovirga aplysinae TaxID=2529853 RepID=UPI0012BD1076|nr:PorP/SprF family type IX secretion system membrane protein [Xanthovirga aplysinae]MTI31099.1 type IX secretion system membrane protein PorP/SprF [Xanthovirga aplysinae]